MKKKFLAGLLIGALTIIPTLNVTTVEAASKSDKKVQTEQTARPAMNNDQQQRVRNGEQPPEPPKDENGNPLPPPDMKDRDNQSTVDQSKDKQSKDKQSKDNRRPPMNDDRQSAQSNGERQQPPEPPKDENGNPLPPPDMKDRDNQSGVDQQKMSHRQMLPMNGEQ